MLNVLFTRILRLVVGVLVCWIVVTLLQQATQWSISADRISGAGERTDSTATELSNIPVHRVAFFDKPTFYSSVDWADHANKANEPLDLPLSGGVVPHHLLPSYMIADFFSRLVAQQPTTIILLGPNHYEDGEHAILTSLYAWETPFGLVQPNTAYIQSLLDRQIAWQDESTLPKDHSVAGVLPFLQYYLPNATVVPLLLSGATSDQELRELAEALSEVEATWQGQTVVIAAVDFSHYLTSAQAEEKDAVTLEIMKNYKVDQLFSLNSDYLDSPQSISILLQVMQAWGSTQMKIFHHTNSGELTQNPYASTTSYYSLGFY